MRLDQIKEKMRVRDGFAEWEIIGGLKWNV